MPRSTYVVLVGKMLTANKKHTHLLRTSLASKKILPLPDSSSVVCAIRPLPGLASGAVNFQSYV